MLYKIILIRTSCMTIDDMLIIIAFHFRSLAFSDQSSLVNGRVSNLSLRFLYLYLYWLASMRTINRTIELHMARETNLFCNCSMSTVLLIYALSFCYHS